MTAKRFMKGDYNENHCEVWLDDEYIGDVRTKDADTFIRMLNTLTNENEQLKKENNELKEKNEFLQKRIDCIIQSLQNDLNTYGMMGRFG